MSVRQENRPSFARKQEDEDHLSFLSKLNASAASSFRTNKKMERWLQSGLLQERPKPTSIYLTRPTFIHDMLQPNKNLPSFNSLARFQQQGRQGGNIRSVDNAKNPSPSIQLFLQEERSRMGIVTCDDFATPSITSISSKNNNPDSAEHNDFLHFACCRHQQPWFLFHDDDDDDHDGDIKASSTRRQHVLVSSLSVPSDPKSSIEVAKRTSRVQRKHFLQKLMNLSEEDATTLLSDDDDEDDENDNFEYNYNNNERGDDDERNQQNNNINKNPSFDEKLNLARNVQESLHDPLEEFSLTSFTVSETQQDFPRYDFDDSISEKNQKTTSSSHCHLPTTRDHRPVQGTVARVRQTFLNSDDNNNSTNDLIEATMAISSSSSSSSKKYPKAKNLTKNKNHGFFFFFIPECLGNKHEVMFYSYYNYQNHNNGNNRNENTLSSNSSMTVNMMIANPASSGVFSFDDAGNNIDGKSFERSMIFSQSSDSSLQVSPTAAATRARRQQREQKPQFGKYVLFSSDNRNNSNRIVVGKQLIDLKIQSKNRNRKLMFEPTATTSTSTSIPSQSSFPQISSHTICVSNLSSCKKFLASSRVQVLNATTTLTESNNNNSCSTSTRDVDNQKNVNISLNGNAAFCFGFTSKRNRRLLLESKKDDETSNTTLRKNPNGAVDDDNKAMPKKSCSYSMADSQRMTELVKISSVYDKNAEKNNFEGDFGHLVAPLGVSAKNLEQDLGFKKILEDQLLRELSDILSHTNSFEQSFLLFCPSESESSKKTTQKRSSVADDEAPTSENNSNSINENISLIEFEFCFPLATSFSPNSEFVATVWNCEATFEIISSKTEKMEQQGLELRRRLENPSSHNNLASTSLQQQESEAAPSSSASQEEQLEKKRKLDEEKRNQIAERRRRCRNLPKRSIFVTRKVQVVVVFNSDSDNNHNESELGRNNNNNNNNSWNAFGSSIGCRPVSNSFNLDAIDAENFTACWKQLTRPRRSVKEYDTTSTLSSAKNNQNCRDSAAIYKPPTEDEEVDEESWFNRAVPTGMNLVKNKNNNNNHVLSQTAIVFNPWEPRIFSILINGNEISFWKVEKFVHDLDNDQSHDDENSCVNNALNSLTNFESAISLSSSGSRSEFSLPPIFYSDKRENCGFFTSHCWYDEDAIAFITNTGILCCARIVSSVQAPDEDKNGRKVEDISTKKINEDPNRAGQDEEDSNNQEENHEVIENDDGDEKIKQKNQNENESSTNHQHFMKIVDIRLISNLDSEKWIGVDCCMITPSPTTTNSAQETNTEFSLFAIRDDGVIVHFVRRFSVVSPSNICQDLVDYRKNDDHPRQNKNNDNSKNYENSSFENLFVLRDEFTTESLFVASSACFSENNNNHHDDNDKENKITSLQFCRDSQKSPIYDPNYWKSSLNVCVSTINGMRYWCSIQELFLLRNNIQHHHRLTNKVTSSSLPIQDDDDHQQHPLEKLFPAIQVYSDCNSCWKLICSSPKLSLNEYLNRNDDGNGRQTKWTHNENSNNNNHLDVEKNSNIILEETTTPTANANQSITIQRDCALSACFSIVPSIFRNKCSDFGLHFLAYRASSRTRQDDSDIIFALAKLSAKQQHQIFSNVHVTNSHTDDTSTISQVGQLIISPSTTKKTEQQEQNNNNNKSNQSGPSQEQDRVTCFALHPSGKFLCVATASSIRLFHATVGSSLATNLREKAKTTRNNGDENDDDENENENKNDDNNKQSSSSSVNFEGGVHFTKSSSSLSIPEIIRVEYDDSGSILLAVQGKRIFVLHPVTLTVNFIFDGHISAVQSLRFVIGDEEEKISRKYNEQQQDSKKRNDSSSTTTTSQTLQDSASSIVPASVISSDVTGNIHVWSLFPKVFSGMEYLLYKNGKDDDSASSSSSDDSDCDRDGLTIEQQQAKQQRRREKMSVKREKNNNKNKKPSSSSTTQNVHSDRAEMRRRAKEQILRDAEQIHGAQHGDILLSRFRNNNNNKNDRNTKYNSNSLFLPSGTNFTGIENCPDEEDAHHDDNNNNNMNQIVATSDEDLLNYAPICKEAIHTIHLSNFLISDCLFASHLPEYVGNNNTKKEHEQDDDKNEENVKNNNISENDKKSKNTFVSTAPWIVAVGRFKDDIPGECRKDGFAVILTSVVDKRKILEGHASVRDNLKKQKKKQKEQQDAAEENHDGGGKSPLTLQMSIGRHSKFTIDLKGTFQRRKLERKEKKEEDEAAERSRRHERKLEKGDEFFDSESDSDEDDNDDDEDAETRSDATSYVLSSHSEVSGQHQNTKKKHESNNNRRRHLDDNHSKSRNHQIILHTGVTCFSTDDADTEHSLTNQLFTSSKKREGDKNSQHHQQQQHITASAALVNKLLSKRCSGRILELIRMTPEPKQNSRFALSSPSLPHPPSSPASSLAGSINRHTVMNEMNSEKITSSKTSTSSALSFTSALLVGRPDGKISCYEYPIRTSGARPYQVLSVFERSQYYYHHHHDTITTNNTSFFNIDDQEQNPIEITSMKFVPESNILTVQSRQGSLAMLRLRNLVFVDKSNEGDNNKKQAKTTLMTGNNSNSEKTNEQSAISITTTTTMTRAQLVKKRNQLMKTLLGDCEDVLQSGKDFSHEKENSSSSSSSSSSDDDLDDIDKPHIFHHSSRKKKKRKSSNKNNHDDVSSPENVVGRQQKLTPAEKREKIKNMMIQRFNHGLETSHYAESFVEVQNEGEQNVSELEQQQKINLSSSRSSTPIGISLSNQDEKGISISIGDMTSSFRLPPRLLSRFSPTDNDQNNIEQKYSGILQPLLPTANTWFVDAANAALPVSRDYLFHLENTKDKIRQETQRVEKASAQKVLAMSRDYENFRNRLKSNTDRHVHLLETQIRQEIDGLRHVEKFHQTFAKDRESKFQNTIDGVILAQHHHEQECAKRVEDGEVKVEIIAREMERRIDAEQCEHDKKLESFRNQIDKKISAVERKRNAEESALVESLRQWDSMIRQTGADFQIQHENAKNLQRERLSQIATAKTKQNFALLQHREAQKALGEEIVVLGQEVIQQRQDEERVGQELQRAAKEEATLAQAVRDMQRDSLSEDAKVRVLHDLRNRLDGVRTDMNRNYDTLFDSIAVRDQDVESRQHRIADLTHLLSRVTDEAVVLSRENFLVTEHLVDKHRRGKLIQKAQVDLKLVEKSALAGVLVVLNGTDVLKHPETALEPLKKLIAETVVRRREVFTTLQNDLDDRVILLSTRYGESGDISASGAGRLGDSFLAVDENGYVIPDGDENNEKKKKKKNGNDDDDDDDDDENDHGDDDGGKRKLLAKNLRKYPPEIQKIMMDLLQSQKTSVVGKPLENNNQKLKLQQQKLGARTNLSEHQQQNSFEAEIALQQKEQEEMLLLAEREKEKQERLRLREIRFQQAQASEQEEREKHASAERRVNDAKLRTELQLQVKRVEKRRDFERKRAQSLLVERNNTVGAKISSTKSLMDEIALHQQACKDSASKLDKLKILSVYATKKKSLLSMNRKNENGGTITIMSNAEQQHQQEKMQELERMHQHPEPTPIGFLSPYLSSSPSTNNHASHQQQHQQQLRETDDQDYRLRFHKLSPAAQHQNMTIDRVKRSVQDEYAFASSSSPAENENFVGGYSIFNHNNNSKNKNFVSPPSQNFHQDHEDDDDGDHHVVLSLPRNQQQQQQHHSAVGSPSNFLKKWKQPFTNSRKLFPHQHQIRQHHSNSNIQTKEMIARPINTLAPTTTNHTELGNNNDNYESFSPSLFLFNQQQQRGMGNNNINNNVNGNPPQARIFNFGGNNNISNNKLIAMSPEKQVDEIALRSIELARQHKVANSLQRKILFDRTALLTMNNSASPQKCDVNNINRNDDDDESTQKPISNDNKNKKSGKKNKNTSSNIPRPKSHGGSRGQRNNNDDEEIDWIGTPKSGNSRASSATRERIL